MPGSIQDTAQEMAAALDVIAEQLRALDAAGWTFGGDGNLVWMCAPGHER